MLCFCVNYIFWFFIKIIHIILLHFLLFWISDLSQHNRTSFKRVLFYSTYYSRCSFWQLQTSLEICLETGLEQKLEIIRFVFLFSFRKYGLSMGHHTSWNFNFRREKSFRIRAANSCVLWKIGVRERQVLSCFFTRLEFVAKKLIVQK